MASYVAFELDVVLVPHDEVQVGDLVGVLAASLFHCSSEFVHHHLEAFRLVVVVLLLLGEEHTCRASSPVHAYIRDQAHQQSVFVPVEEDLYACP